MSMPENVKRFGERVWVVCQMVVSICVIPWSVWVTRTLFSHDGINGTHAQMILQQERRLSMVETTGSITVKEHVKLDDERIENIKRRIAIVEEALAAIPKMQIDLAVIREKLDNNKK